METPEYAVSRFQSINAVTCYMNSILGILQQTPKFIDYLISIDLQELITSKYTREEIDDLVTFQLYKLLNLSLSHDDIVFTPTSLRKTLTKKSFIWGENEHQDSQEFLNFLISTIEEEISLPLKFVPGLKDFHACKEKNVITNLHKIVSTITWQNYTVKEISPVKTLFTGMSKNYLECSYCKNKSNKFEIFQTLSLSIPIKHKVKDLYKKFTLYELFDNYFEPEKLDKHNMIKCDFCMVKNKQTKNTIFWRTPEILVIQIKRFRMNDYGVITQKLNNMIEYPVNDLDITNYIDDNSEYKTKGKYKLYGVNCHHTLGNFNTINAGHYTSIVKNRLTNKWTHYDDSRPVEDIEYMKELVNNRAYLLFYVRKD